MAANGKSWLVGKLVAFLLTWGAICYPWSGLEAKDPTTWTTTRLIGFAAIVGGVWLLFTAIVIIAIFKAELAVPFQLLRQHHNHLEHEFPMFSAFKDLGICLLWSDFQDLCETARLRIEYSIWEPEVSGGGDRASHEQQFIKTYLQHRAQQVELTTEDEVSIDNCFVLQEKREIIEHYFLSMAELPKRLPERDRFLIEARIKNGYLAPQFLVAGLMSQFDEDWQPVISAFLKEVNAQRTDLPSCAFKRIQMFIYNCWLLWGPSIPIGTCVRWKTDSNSITALQYGYGDENNSLPLLPLVGKDGKAYQTLFRYVRSSPFAVKASLKVRPVWIAADPAARSADVANAMELIQGAQRSIWNPPTIAENLKGTLVLDYADAPNMSGLPEDAVPDDQKSYYSAYVWVIFILCRRNPDGTAGDPVFPATLAEGAGPKDTSIAFNNTDVPWLGMFPFFEHGNIADDATYAAFKRQLAFKSLASIEGLLQETFPDQHNSPFREHFVLRYACASDDANCADCVRANLTSSDVIPEQTHFRSSTRIRDYFADLIGVSEGSHIKSQADHGRFASLAKSIVFDSNWKYRAAFSSCHLPDIIDLFYKKMPKDSRSR